MIKQSAIYSGVLIDHLLRCVEGMPQDKCEEDAKKGQSNDTTLLDSTANVKGLGDVSIKLHSPLYHYINAV